MTNTSSFKHFLIHKPKGYLSQFIYEGKRKGSKKLLGELGKFPAGTMSIGRLDEKTEGLLILTTNGMESENVRSSKVEKEYFVQVDGLITEEAILQLKNGLEIGILGKRYVTKPCKAKTISEVDVTRFPIEIYQIRDPKHGPTSWISITVTEGKFRQIRKMTAGVGFPTLRLVRVRIGKIHLNLPIGEIKEIIEIDV
ncbi:MAG: pseudouridine synthase [Flavobacteriales bacterium]